MARRIVRWLALLAVLAGCGTTNQDVINEQKGAMDALRARLSAIAARIPERATASTAPSGLVPRPQYNATPSANTDILMYDQLLDPDDALADPTDLDLLLSEHLLSPLRWTGPDNPMAESTLGESAGDFAQNFTRAAGLSYLGVARVREYEPAVAIDEETYTGGHAAIDGYLIALGRDEIICSFSISATPDTSVSYSAKPDEDRKTQLEKFVRSSIWDSARTKLIAGFGEACNGDFSLE